jgi:hypothetical protein
MTSEFILSLGMVSLSHPLHYSVKPVVFVSSVLHSSDGSVCVQNTVGTLHHVAVSRLPLVLDVTGVGVVNCVIELILRVSLRQQEYNG